MITELHKCNRVVVIDYDGVSLHNLVDKNDVLPFAK